MVTFGVKTGPRSTVRLMEFTADGSLLHDRRDSFNGFAFLHDFAITPTGLCSGKTPSTSTRCPLSWGKRCRPVPESNPKGQA